MGKPFSTPENHVLILQLLENMENPILKRSDLEYIDADYKKTFNDIKNELLKSDGYHHCVLKVCYYDKNNQLQEYEEANKKNNPLKIKDSIFKPVKEKNRDKTNIKSIIPIVLLNNGECICEKLIQEKLKKEIEEKYKGRESQFKQEIEQLKKYADETIIAVKNIKEIKKQASKKDIEIQELQKKVDFIKKEKEKNEEERKKILDELNNMKEEMKENPNNQKSLTQFNVNKGKIENDVIKKARNNIDTYF